MSSDTGHYSHQLRSLGVCGSSWTNESVYSAGRVNSIVRYEMNRLEKRRRLGDCLF